MKILPVILGCLVLVAYVPVARSATVDKATPAGGLSDPTNVQVFQGGSSCSNNNSTNCATNTQALTWTASPGATSYTVLRNGSTLASKVSCCSYTDRKATNSNVVNTYGDETQYVYQVQAVNGSGSSPGAYAASYMYTNGANQSCGNYSGGGFGGYKSSAVQMTYSTSNGHVATITVNSGAVYPYQGFTDAAGVIRSSALDGGTGNMYILPYGYGGTTGTGTGTGTYYLSSLPTGNAASDNIWGDPSPTVGGGGGLEACAATSDGTLNAEPGHTYFMATYWPNGGGYLQQFTGSPQSPTYDLNTSAFNNAVVDVYPTNVLHTFTYTVHSRPGGQAPNTGDIYSTRAVTIMNGSSSSYISGGTITANSWNHLVIPLSALGLGQGQFTGYVTANWHGTATVSGSTLTIASTTDGNAGKIAAGDFIMILQGDAGWACAQATGPASGSSVPVTTCPGSGAASQGKASPAYDAQLCASAYTTQPGPDNASLIEGNGEPPGTYSAGQQAGFSGNTNPTGTGSCSGTGAGHWGLFNGLGSTITSQGSAGSQLSNWVSRRVSVYKPEIINRGPNPNIAMGIDNYGFTH